MSSLTQEISWQAEDDHSPYAKASISVRSPTLHFVLIAGLRGPERNTLVNKLKGNDDSYTARTAKYVDDRGQTTYTGLKSSVSSAHTFLVPVFKVKRINSSLLLPYFS